MYHLAADEQLAPAVAHRSAGCYGQVCDLVDGRQVIPAILTHHLYTGFVVCVSVPRMPASRFCRNMSLYVWAPYTGFVQFFCLTTHVRKDPQRSQNCRDHKIVLSLKMRITVSLMKVESGVGLQRQALRQLREVVVAMTLQQRQHAVLVIQKAWRLRSGAR